MTRSGWVFATLVLNLADQISGDFKTQFLGNFITDEEYYNKTFCWSKVCMLDSDRLIYNADHHSVITDPCKDFKTFAVGEFFEHRVVSERYPFIGFVADLHLQFFEKQKRLINKKPDVHEPKVFKVLRNFFKQCADFRLIENQARKDVVAYLQRRASFPLLNGTWTDHNFNIDELFAVDPEMAMKLFYDHKLAHCTHDSKEILCFQISRDWVHEEIREFDAFYALNRLGLDRNLANEASKNLFDFLKEKKPTQDNFSANWTREVIKIKNLSEKFPKIRLNWLKVINSLLLTSSAKTEDDDILIESTELFEELSDAFEKLDKRTVSNIFAAAFFFTYNKLFILHSFDQAAAKLSGAKRSYQRFEQCISALEKQMNPAMTAFMAHKLYDLPTQEAATVLIKTAIDDVLQQIKSKPETDLQKKLFGKLSTVKLMVMFPDESRNLTAISQFYDQLQIHGNESFVDTFFEIDKLNTKIVAEPQSSWIKQLDKIGKQRLITYFFDENIFYVPVKFTLYPFFHPNRPRYFNLATLYMTVVEAYNKLVVDSFGISGAFSYLAFTYTLVDRNFVEWEKNGGKELELPAFKMTHHQMLWLCIAQVYAQKYHHNFRADDRRNYNLNKNFNSHYRQFAGFQNAFNCSGQ